MAGNKKDYTLYDRDSVGYLHQLGNLEYKLARKVIKRDADGFAMKDAEGKCMYDRDNWNKVDGREVILTKLQMVREWLKKNWNIDIDELRKEVQNRQYATDANGDFILDANGNYINKLTQPYEGDPSKTLFEYLNEETDGYENLHQEALMNQN